jgi:hypothetical protein
LMKDMKKFLETKRKRNENNYSRQPTRYKI